MAVTKTKKKLTEAELVDQQTAPAAAQPATPADMAAVQQPAMPAGTEPMADPNAAPADPNAPQEDVSTPTEAQTPVAGMNDDGSFNPPAPGMIPSGWVNPADLQAALTMTTGDAEVGATAPDAQVTDQPVVSPEGQDMMGDAAAAPAADSNALTPEDQNMMESLTHQDFELLREYKRYKEEQDEKCAITAQNDIQEEGCKVVSGFGEAHTEFKDAALHVDFGPKCIVITSSDPIVRADLEAKLLAAGFGLTNFIPGIADDAEKFETKIIVSKNALEQKELAWRDDAVEKHEAEPVKDAETLVSDSEDAPVAAEKTEEVNKAEEKEEEKKEEEKEEKEEPEKKDDKKEDFKESIELEDPVSNEAGEDVAQETEDIMDAAVAPSVAQTEAIKESKKRETLSESIKRMFREAEQIPDSPEDLPAPGEEDILGEDEADVDGLFADETPEEGSLEAQLAALFDAPEEEGDAETDGEEPEAEAESDEAKSKAAQALNIVADHLTQEADRIAQEADHSEEPEVEEPEEEAEDLIPEDEEAVEEEPADDEIEENFPDPEPMEESVERIPVKMPSRPFAKEEKPQRQVLRARESIQYPAGSRPEENLVHAYESSLAARRAAMAKFRESFKASKTNSRFSEALRQQPVRTSEKLTERTENTNAWKNNRFIERQQEIDALDYKELLRNGFLG